MALPVRCGTKWNPMAIDYVFIAADVCFLVALRHLACSLGGTCCCVWMSVLVYVSLLRFRFLCQRAVWMALLFAPPFLVSIVIAMFASCICVHL